jgi:hypothetical protein
MPGCGCCGATLPDEPDSIRLRIALPDAAHETPHSTLPDGAVLVDGAAYVRCLLPVALSGGLELVLGTWLRTGDSTLANDIDPFDLLGAQVTTTVRQADEPPWVDGSADEGVREVLTEEWDRDEVLRHVEHALPVAVRTRISDEWLLERTAGLDSRVVDGTMRFAGPGRTVYADQLVDEQVRTPEEFLGDLIAEAPAAPPEHTVTTGHGDEVRHVFWQTAVVDGHEQHELYGFVVRPGSALAVNCVHDDPADHRWAQHVVNSTRYLTPRESNTHDPRVQRS